MLMMVKCHFKEKTMKKFVIAYVISLLFVTSVFAGTKCVADGKGGICCWDTETEGVFKPINCG